MECQEVCNIAYTQAMKDTYKGVMTSVRTEGRIATDLSTIIRLRKNVNSIQLMVC